MIYVAIIFGLLNILSFALGCYIGERKGQDEMKDYYNHRY